MQMILLTNLIIGKNTNLDGLYIIIRRKSKSDNRERLDINLEIDSTKKKRQEDEYFHTKIKKRSFVRNMTKMHLLTNDSNKKSQP